MKKHRIAMIGVGNISPVHQGMLSAMPDRCEVVGINDINPETLAKKAELWGCAPFDKLEDLLALEPDVCWIMTPVGPRIELFEKCFAAGCDIFTEKPLALNNEDAETCVRLAEEAGKTLGFGCNSRNDPATHLMANTFFSGVLGDLVKVYAHTYIQRGDEFWATKFDQPDAWRLTFEGCGGRIFEFSIHQVNWVLWVGGAPTRVGGVNDAVSPTLAKVGLDDVVSAQLHFRQGYGVVETIMAPGNRSRMDVGIIGTKGECWLDGGKVRLLVPGEDRDETLAPPKCPNRAEDFLDALDEGRKPLNDADAALVTTRTCCAFNESVRTKQIVAL